MDTHEQLLGVAATLRTASLRASAASAPSVAEELRAMADRIDSPPLRQTDDGDPVTAVETAIAQLEAVPEDERPTSVLPMRDQLRRLLTQLHPSA